MGDALRALISKVDPKMDLLPPESRNCGTHDTIVATAALRYARAAVNALGEEEKPREPRSPKEGMDE